MVYKHIAVREQVFVVFRKRKMEHMLETGLVELGDGAFLEVLLKK